MKYAYIVRFPNDDGPFARHYGIRSIPQGVKDPTKLGQLLGMLRLNDITPPTLRRKRKNITEWDYCNEFHTSPKFRAAYPHIFLKPGEGPILVDLDDISTERTSKRPEH